MPLVVPGIQSKGNEELDMWSSQLKGKKLGDGQNNTFAKQELPKEHRIIEHDGMSTMDHKPDRLNIHVDKEGTVKDVKFG